jgi:predicted chitinase
MRIHDLISDSPETIEEGWKDTLGNLAIAGAIGLGGAGGMAVKNAYNNYQNQSSELSQQLAQKQTTSSPQVKKTAKKVARKITVNPITNKHLEHMLLSVAKRAGLSGTELAAFMAQCAHESADFSSLVEIGKRSSFKKYDPKFAPKLAKILGNRFAGDGERYRGRGFIQLTGRWNYRLAGEALGLPLEDQPELAARPDIAAKIAIWYWQTRVQSKVSNFHDVASVTKFINPGMHGLHDRRETFNAYMNSAT